MTRFSFSCYIAHKSQGNRMEIIMQVSPFNEEIWKFSDLASSEAFSWLIRASLPGFNVCSTYTAFDPWYETTTLKKNHAIRCFEAWVISSRNWHLETAFFRKLYYIGYLWLCFFVLICTYHWGTDFHINMWCHITFWDQESSISATGRSRYKFRKSARK